MATKKTDPKKAASDLAKATEEGLAKVIHERDKDAVRRAANNSTTWSLDSGGDEGSNDRYMKSIGKGGIAVQQMGMRDVADNEDEDQARKDAVKHKIPSYKKGGRVRKTGLALLHKGEKVIPRHKVSPRKK